jgi:hypothetical protein
VEGGAVGAAFLIFDIEARVCVTDGLLLISADQEVLLFGRARGEGPICDQTSGLLQELRSSVAAYVRPIIRKRTLTKAQIGSF